MKTMTTGIILAVLTSAGAALAAEPLGSAFTYQGRLAADGAAANGSFDLRLTLYDQASSGHPVGQTITNLATEVAGGYFCLTLDFSSPVVSREALFNGDARWLEIAVRTNGARTGFTALSPRQLLTPAPEALHAAGAASAEAVTGPVAASQLTGAIPPATITNGTITGAMLADGAVTSRKLADGAVNADKIASGAVNHLDSPDGMPTGAVAVNTNGLTGIGTFAPVAGLHIASTAPVLTPALLAEVVDGTGAFTNLGGAVSVAVWSNLVAIGSYSGSAVTLMNMDNPAAPVYRWSVRDGSGSFTNLANVAGVALSSNCLAVASTPESAVTLVDVSNPAAPVWRARIRDGVGGFNDMAGASHVMISGNVLTIAARYDSAVSLVNISSPANPVLLGVIKDGVNGFTNLLGAYALARAGNLLAIGALDDEAVTLVDVSDPANPILRACLRNGVGGFNYLARPGALAIAHNLLAIASGIDDAITLVDITLPSAPILRAVVRKDSGDFATLDYPTGIGFQGSTLWVAAYEGNALLAIDVSRPAAPVLRCALRNGVLGFNHLDYSASVAGSGNTIVVGAYEAVTLLSGTNTSPAGMISEGWVGIGTTTPAAALHVKGDLLAETGSFNIESPGAAVHSGSVGRVASTAAWKPNPDAISDEGVWLQGGIFRAGGFYADDSIAAIWSAGYPDLLRVYNSHALSFGPRFVIDGAGKVGVLTNNPQSELHVAGVVTAEGLKFSDGSLQTTAAQPPPALYGTDYAGSFPARTNRFLAAPVTVTITNSSQKVLVTAFEGLGSAGGATGLRLFIGYQEVGSTTVSVVGNGITVQVPAGTVIPMGLSGMIQGLTPGQYRVGLCGRCDSDAAAADWDMRSNSSTTAIEL